MKRLFYALAVLAVISCTSKPLPLDDSSVKNVIRAEKASWIPATKGADDQMVAKDLPWSVGDKVMLLRSNQVLENWDGQNPVERILCTVSTIDGLKCTLVPDTPLEEGTFRAFYPVYDYAFYDYIHLSFLYEEGLGLDAKNQDVVVSDPVSYQEEQELSFVMKHVCALVDIDIYPPKTGNYSFLKLFAESPVFAGKVNYFFDKEYSIDDIADGWLNFTTLRGQGRSLKEGEVFWTSTGLLPIQYNEMPMCIHIVYEDGTHFISESFAMPSLSFGVENHLDVRDFKETTEPMNGLWGDYYDDKNPTPYEIN